MTETIKDVFINIDFDQGTYNIKDISMKIKDLSIIEMEELQNREAEIADLQNSGKKLTAKEVLHEARKWQDFILDTAFGDQWKKQKIKEKLTAAEFKRLIEEVFVFLGNYSGPQGALDYMNSLTAKS